MADKHPGYSYIGRWPCGCVVAVVADGGDKFTADAVRDFIKSGLKVERVTAQYVKENFIDGNDCPHRQKQLALNLDDAATRPGAGEEE